MRIGVLVDAARGAVPGFVQCGTHLFPPFQFLAKAIDAAGVRVRAWRDAEHAFERAREPPGVTTRPLPGGDGARGLADQRHRGIAPPRVGGMAALAGAIAFALGRLWNGKERDLGAAGPAAGAGRAAVDPGRADRIDERAVTAAISCQHGLPALSGTHGPQHSLSAGHHLSVLGRQTQVHFSSADGP